MNISYILIHWNANSFAKRSCVLCFFSTQIIVPFFNGIFSKFAVPVSFVLISLLQTLHFTYR